MAPAPAAHAGPAAPAQRSSAGAAAPAPQRPTSAPQRSMPAPIPAAASLSPVDKILAIAAAIIGLIAVGSTAYLAFML